VLNLGIRVSFFKKNKSKEKRSKPPLRPDQSDIERDIAKMDRDRHLDMQLEELTAQLNMKPDEPKQSMDSPGSPISEMQDDNDIFLTQSLQNFAIPSFTASLNSETKNIDVTTTEPQSEIPNITTETTIDTQKISETITAQEVPDAPAETLPVENAEIITSSPSRLNMGEMRLDVAKISADIQSGEELYRRALQRVEGLMGFVEKAEVDFSVLNRLEPENRRLKAKLRTSNSEVESFKSKISLLATDLEDQQNRLAEKTKQYEEARSKLTIAAQSLQEYERALKKSKNDTERYALAINRHKTALSVEGNENKVLREKMGELSSALELRQAEFLEASKIVESLRVDCADFRNQADTFRTEAQDLRITLNTSKRQNSTMKSEMQRLHEDIKTFKTQYEFNVINREDQITDLEEKLAFASKELDLKTELAESATQDVASLRRIRNEQDVERSDLEKKLSAAHNELKDIKGVIEARNADTLAELQGNIKDLQDELQRRDDSTQHSLKEASDLERQFTSLELEHKQLQSRFDLQTQQLTSAINNNPASALEAQIQTLSKQLSIKDDIVKSAAQDVEKLREDREKQLIKQKQLEDLIHSQTFQLEAAQKALLESKQAETELDQKYKNVAAALSVNQTRRRSETRSESPDIAPDISDEINTLSGDDIEDRILDYKFGIRKDII